MGSNRNIPEQNFLKKKPPQDVKFPEINSKVLSSIDLAKEFDVNEDIGKHDSLQDLGKLEDLEDEMNGFDAPNKTDNGQQKTKSGQQVNTFETVSYELVPEKYSSNPKRQSL